MGLEFIDGNEAIARAAIEAGCGFFAGYPITPASTILQHMLELLPEAGGVAMQAEDEIASIGFCIGASMAGAKAMTATSGPGISLYSENIGLAIIGETPLVIVDIQRQGPATGSARNRAHNRLPAALKHCTNPFDAPAYTRPSRTSTARTAPPRSASQITSPSRRNRIN